MLINKMVTKLRKQRLNVMFRNGKSTQGVEYTSLYWSRNTQLNELMLVFAKNQKTGQCPVAKVTMVGSNLSFDDLLEEKGEAFSELICKEAGKPHSYSKGEIARCLFTLNLAKEEATRFEGEKVPIDFGLGAGKTAYTRPFPIGPILAISPFNFPLNLVMHKVAPALAAGCPVILKPSPYTPLTSLAFGELVDEAGFPPGTLNVLVCKDSEAESLVRDERLKALSFTGSPKVGWFLKTIAGMKKVILELGGNAAVIVDENIDIKKVAQDICAGSFLYSGQMCISTQRVYAHKKVFTTNKK